MRTLILVVAGGFACLVAEGIPAAAAEVDDEGKLEVYGDFRLRAEVDRDSHRADGSERGDRSRIRVRARLGINWRPLDHLTFGVRLRTGSDDSQQSPHITILDFDDNDTGDAHVNLDKWFVEARHGKVRGWAGRNGLPFWKQNELFWDDDVTPAGLAGGLVHPVGDKGKLNVNLGYFSLPVGMQAFAGNLGLAQVVYGHDGDRVDFTVAGGLLDIEANPADMDAVLLRNGNGLRDYQILVVSGQCRVEAGGKPLTFGLDFSRNGEDYTAADPFAFANRDQTDGHVASVTWGGTSKRGDWLVGYWYADIETLAVHASYAEDDWERWGSATQTDSSDLRGHELRFAYGFGRAGNVVTRLYLVESAGGFALDGAGLPVSTDSQDGNRLRIDYNVKF